MVVEGLKDQINSKYYCKDAFESNMIHTLGIKSCGIISTILSDGWLKFLYDKLQAEDGAGTYDSDFWMTHIADPSANLSCAMLAFYTENIPEVIMIPISFLIVLRYLSFLRFIYSGSISMGTSYFTNS